MKSLCVHYFCSHSVGESKSQAQYLMGQTMFTLDMLVGSTANSQSKGCGCNYFTTMTGKLDAIIPSTTYGCWSSRTSINNLQGCRSSAQTFEIEIVQNVGLKFAKQRRVSFWYLCFLPELAFWQSGCRKCLSVDSRPHFGLIELLCEIWNIYKIFPF